MLYEALGGASWHDNTGWQPGLTCVVPHQNQWHGTACGDGAITRLELRENNLQGTLPTELGLLPSLKLLRIEGNPLLSGTIPSQLGALRGLSTLSLGNNTQLSGTLPESITGMGDLRFLRVDDNALSGSLPMYHAEHFYPNLRHFSASSNALAGHVPPAQLMVGVSFWSLHTNRLSGTLPTEVGLLTTMRDRLHLHTNRISGVLPTQLGMLTQVALPALHKNAISGTLPTELARLEQLLFPSLSYNRISGTTPSQIQAKWTSIQARLDLATNPIGRRDADQWVGHVPSQQSIIDVGIAERTQSEPVPRTWYDSWARCEYRHDPAGRERCSVSAK